jgi:hypothetical protein
MSYTVPGEEGNPMYVLFLDVDGEVELEDTARFSPDIMKGLQKMVGCDILRSIRVLDLPRGYILLMDAAIHERRSPRLNPVASFMNNYHKDGFAIGGSVCIVRGYVKDQVGHFQDMEIDCVAGIVRRIEEVQALLQRDRSWMERYERIWRG